MESKSVLLGAGTASIVADVAVPTLPAGCELAIILFNLLGALGGLGAAVAAGCVAAKCPAIAKYCMWTAALGGLQLGYSLFDWPLKDVGWIFTERIVTGYGLLGSIGAALSMVALSWWIAKMNSSVS